MVRVAGLTYTMDLTQSHGKRIQNIAVRGKPLAVNKTYKVAGWASVQESPAGTRPIWEVVAEYLRAKKSVTVGKPYLPRLRGVQGNPGLGT